MFVRQYPRRALLAGTSMFLALALAGCGSADDGGADHTGMASGTPSTTTTTAPSPVFNDADVMFAQAMIPHHQQAVEMARLVATRPGSDQLRRLAVQIERAQSPEIATLRGWLTEWGKPEHGDGGHGTGSMGMMSAQDMTRLAAATDTEFDRMFVQMMIAHHQGAIDMARDEAKNGVNSAARQLASRIERTQSTEITTLRTLLPTP